MNTISVCIHVRKEPAACPKCGSAIWIAFGLCLGCMLSQGIGATGQTSRTLDELLSEIGIDETDSCPRNSQIPEEIDGVKIMRIARCQSEQSRLDLG
jgi:hypothetical protein